MSSVIYRYSLLLLLLVLAGGCVSVPPFGGVCEGSYYVSDDWNPEEGVQDGLLGSDDLTTIAGCEVIEGGLTISNASLSTLDDLSNLSEVRGHLVISENDSLSSIDGLSGLISIGGHLYITNNTGLTNLDGLSGLNSVDGDVSVHSNPVLCQSSVDAFIAACTIGGGVFFTDNNDGC